ncbi:hypothetical protein POM88_042747 [Heracleum sosnowskyi]|uniref:Autophagy-related protein n=1 Tax=Heracleum sosnowskyi TaxID=360622 RepID=A0AAD8MAY0_9APIA|nr:hypothetical protein POM88_042747 [Heracleum sosnowskyi]
MDFAVYDARLRLAANSRFRPARSSAFRELVTLSAATCSFKSEKSLEERQSEIARIREQYPDRIPVMILRDKESPMYYPRIKLLIPAKSNLGSCFILIWKKIYDYKSMSRTYSLINVPERWDPIFKKPMPSVYEEYKDEDGCLYITVSGEWTPLIHQPIPSNMNTWTCYVTS